jgi:hypothetical protein
MPKIFTVKRKDFLKDFLAPIKKIGSKIDYLPFGWGEDGNLQTIVPYESKVFLVASHKPAKAADDSRERFFVRSPDKIYDLFSLIDDESVSVKIDSSSLQSRASGFRMKCMLIDPLVGERGSLSVLTHERVKDFQPIDVFVLNKDSLRNITKISRSFKDPNTVVGFDIRDDSVWATFEQQGESVDFDLQVKPLANFNPFKFSTAVFGFLERGDADVNVAINDDVKKKVAFMKIDHGSTFLNYVVIQKN